MSPPSHSLTVTGDIPLHVSPENAIRLLHDHVALILLQPLVTSAVAVPAPPGFHFSGPGEEAHFGGPNSLAHLHHYTVSETITLIPGIGAWGKKSISFDARFLDTPEGVKGYSDAGLGVGVYSTFTVQPKEGGEGGWVLRQDVRAECPWLLMPLIKLSFQTAQEGWHKNVIAKLAEIRKEEGGGDAGTQG
jgi:hypothetical protein